MASGVPHATLPRRTLTAGAILGAMQWLWARVSIALFLVALASSPAIAQEADPVTLIRAHYAAWNRVNPEAVLDTFAADAVVDDNGTVYSNPEQVRAWVLTFLTPGQNIVADPVSADGPHLTWRWTRLGDASRQRLGIPEFEGEGEAIVERGKITYFRLAPDRTANAEHRASYSAALAAASARMVAVVSATATAEAISVRASASGVLRRVSDTQERRTPSVMPWVVAGALALFGCGALAVFQRPHAPS